MAFKMKKAGVKQIISELYKASKTHKGQADKLQKMVGNSPMKKISAACKASAKRKYDVWPSAYASGWGVRCTKAGGPSKMGESKDK
jgi:hypothetical protein